MESVIVSIYAKEETGLNKAVLIQSLKQMWGIIVMEHRYRGHFPDVDHYKSENDYTLPFHGAWTVVNGGVSKKTSHSWDIPTQRYAYDFLILDEKGRSFCGEGIAATDFYCYGKAVLAPADGIVEEVCTENPDSPITAERDATCSGRDIRGNYILLRHGEREYSLLAHMKPGSIIVMVGQSVKRGEKIGECGNSGNTSEPHLHFQVQAGKSFYSSFGLPIAFADVMVEETANYENFDDRKLREGEDSSWPPYIEVGQTVCSRQHKI